MNAFVFIEADVGTAGDVAIEAARLAGVRSAEEVTGPYDVIVQTEVSGGRALAELVSRIRPIEGVTRIVTCLVQAHAPTPA